MWELTFKVAARRHCTFCTGIYFSTEAEAHLSQSLWHSVTALVAQACLSTQPSNLIKAQPCSCFVEIVLRGILCPQFHRTVHLSNLQCLILKSVTNEYSSSINYLVALLGGVSYTVNLCFSTWVSKSLFWDLEKKQNKTKKRWNNNSKQEAFWSTVWEVRFESGSQMRFSLCGRKGGD